MTIKEWRYICQKKGKGHLDWTERPSRAVSIYFTIIFAKLGVTGNQLSTFNVLVAISSGFLYSFGVAWWPAALLLQVLNHVWDACDGELARYRGSGTLSGLYLDRLGSWYLYPAILFGLGVGVFRETDLLIAVVLGALGGFAMLQGRLAISGAYWCAVDALLYGKQTGGLDSVTASEVGSSERDMVKTIVPSGVLSIPYWVADFLFSRNIGLDITMLFVVISASALGRIELAIAELIAYGVGGLIAAAAAAVTVFRTRQAEQSLIRLRQFLEDGE